jgi:HK97 family phage portal protein
MITKPSPLTRLKAAYQFYRHGISAFKTPPNDNRRVPFIWPAWRVNNPQWRLHDYETYAREGFELNPILFSAIMYKARAGAMAPLQAYSGSKQDPKLLPETHPLQKLCRRPNKFQSWPGFMRLALTCFNLAGNCYILFERQGGVTAAMYVMRPDRVVIVPTEDKKEVLGYCYLPEGRAWPNGEAYMARDVMHIKNPNPIDPLDGLGYGTSPVTPAAYSIDVDNDLTRFFHLFFKNGAMPTGILKYDIPLMDDEVSNARERFMEFYGGMENWAGPAVLDQGGSYEKIGLTFQEMDVSKIDARTESRIVATLGVPLTLIESRAELVHSTYNNVESDRVRFWEDTMDPELELFEREIEWYLGGDDTNEFVMFDRSASPSARAARAIRVAEFHNAYKEGAVTVDEYRAILDPNLPPAPDELTKKPEQTPMIPPINDDEPDVVAQAEEVVQRVNGRNGNENR